MKDIKDLFKTAVDKIKTVVEKEDIPLADAYAQMDAELEEAEKAYGKPLFPDDGNRISIEEHYLKLFGFDSKVSFDEIKARHEELVKKFNPENFVGDEEKQKKALSKIEKINKVYQYFEEKYNNNHEEE